MIMDDFPQGFKERYAELLGDEAEAFLPLLNNQYKRAFGLIR